MLTIEPLSPVALVNMLTVLPDPAVLKVTLPEEFVVANKLTPLNVVSLI